VPLFLNNATEPYAKGTGMIGAAEPLLWPAERVASEVGIVYPRSSFFWDQKDVKLPHGIMDCPRPPGAVKRL
jgi:hypothetical protein